MIRHSALLLLSGGLDSAANLVLADKVEAEVALCLTIDYGQKAAKHEMEHAKKLADHFGVEHIAHEMRGFSKLINKKSALLASDLDLPSPTDLDDPEITEDSARAVWVPNRNGVMLSIAAALAEARSLDAILVGFNKEEAATFPDNTPEYMQAFEAALKFSTLNQIKVLSATKDMNKTEIVQSVHEHEFPFELLWSCYRNFEGMHCGQCESCKRLSRALEQGLSHDLYSKVHAEIFG